LRRLTGFVSLVLSVTATLLATAAPISLTSAQRARLAHLVESDAGARKLSQSLKRQADASLDDPGHPVVTITTAGKLNADPAKIASRAGLADMKKLAALGYTFAVTSNEVYSAAARRIILAWARTYRPTGAPIDETKLEPLLVAYDLTRVAFPPDDAGMVNDWLLRLARAEQESRDTNSITAINNWNSHRLKTVGLIGYLLDDPALIEWAVNGFRQQVAVNLRADGSSLDFHERDALHYHCYNLEPLLTLAIAARLNGIELYPCESPTGSSLSKSVAFLVPYCDGSRTHAEWVHSKVAFDRTRAEAGEAKFRIGSPFDPRDGLRALELAAAFDARLDPLVAKIAGRPGARFPTWQTVLNEVARP